MKKNKRGEVMVEDFRERNAEDEVIDWKSFIVPASDGKGHNVRTQFRLQAGHVQQISTILRTRAFPYRDQGDFIRHAIHRLLNYLEPLLPEGVNSVTKQVDTILETQKHGMFNEEYMQVFAEVSKRVYMYLEKGEVKQAHRVILETISSIKAMPKGYWRDTYMTEVDKRFGYILDKADRVPLIVKVNEYEEEE